MAELVTNEVRWKKGERGIQTFTIYDSDGTTKRTLTGNTYTFKFWTYGATSNTGSGSLSLTDPTNGGATYAVSSTDTATAGIYLGEIVENGGTSNELHTATFGVIVEDSAPA